MYNAWLMDGSDVGKNGIKYNGGCSVALETQGFPDAPNHANFPSINLNPDEQYHHIAEYRFGSTFEKIIPMLKRNQIYGFTTYSGQMGVHIVKKKLRR